MGRAYRDSPETERFLRERKSVQHPWVSYPSGTSNGVYGTDRTFVEPPESIGTPLDAPATDVAEENSAFALLKGIATNFGVPAGTGDANANTTPHGYPDPLATLGQPTDDTATDTERWSAISLLKGLMGRWA